MQLVICTNSTGRTLSYFSSLHQNFLMDCAAAGVDRGRLKNNWNGCLVIGAALLNFSGRCCSAQGVSNMKPFTSFFKWFVVFSVSFRTWWCSCISCFYCFIASVPLWVGFSIWRPWVSPGSILLSVPIGVRGGSDSPSSTMVQDHLCVCSCLLPVAKCLVNWRWSCAPGTSLRVWPTLLPSGGASSPSHRGGKNGDVACPPFLVLWRTW